MSSLTTVQGLNGVQGSWLSHEDLIIDNVRLTSLILRFGITEVMIRFLDDDVSIRVVLHSVL